MSQPGIAVYDQSTLGGWWLIKIKDKLTLVKQTDIGPAPWTGRKFDFTYTAVSGLGYTTANFPTDASASGVYLGKTPADVQKSIAGAASSLTGNAPNIAGWLQTVAGKGPVFGVTQASGSKAGPFDTGSVDTGNSAVQPSGPSNLGSGIADFITNGSNWLRLGEVLLGALLLMLGLRAMTGGEGNPVTVAKSVARKAAIA